MANVLVVGPHPDDQEAGMGATIAKLVDQGHDVLLLDMTNGEPTPLGDPATREQEAKKAAEVLGVRRVMLELPGEARGEGGERAWGGRAAPNRWIEHTIEARRAVAGVIREHRAEIVFCPFFEDAHPDHRATTRIVEDARFDAKLSKANLPGARTYPKWLFYYYATHLRWVANPTFCIDVTGYEQKKIDAIEAYHTQFVLPTQQADEHAPNRGLPGASGSVRRSAAELFGASMTYFGTRIGARSAEPFFTKEPIGLGSLEGLVF
ncbi:MAG: PIG-L family deacetylase [Planctomycetota bacterium]